MHCYFHLSNGRERIVDQEGMQVEDVEEAWAQAREAVREVLAEGEIEAAVWKGWHIEGMDVSGNLLFRIEIDPGAA